MFMDETNVYTAIFIFNLCVWTNEMRKRVVVGIYNVKTASGITEQISATMIVALFMFVYFFLITFS